ncbi:DUF748 domain-containing protein [beta proteobacterium MWH-UniP1]
MKYLIRFRVALISLAVLMVSFGLIGALWLPDYVKTQTEQALSQSLGRTVTIGKIQISPYILQLRFHDFRIAQSKNSNPEQTAVQKNSSSAANTKTTSSVTNQDHLLAIKTITANLSSLSIVHRAPVLQELKIDSPDIKLARDGKGRLSIADILETLAKAPKSEKPFRFAVHNIQLTQGSIDFQDGIKKKTHTVRDLAIGVPVVINFPAKEEIWIEPSISAKVNGAAFELKGKTHVFGEKKEAVLDLNIQDFPLAGLETYADMIPGLKITKGSVSTKLALSFTQEQGQAATTELKGDVRFANLSATHKPTDSHLHSTIEELNLNLQGLQIAMPDLMAKSRVESIELASGTNGRMILADPTLKGVNPFVASNIALKLNPIELSGATPAAIDLAAQINQRGKVAVKGNVSGWSDLNTSAGSLDVQASQVDVIAFQRFVAGFLHNALFTRGQANFEGKILIGAQAGGRSGEAIPAVRVSGNASLNDFSLLDQTSSAEIARWKQIQLRGLQVATNPFKASIRDINANNLFGRITILPSGELNFRHILEAQATSEPSAGSTMQAKPSSATPKVSGTVSDTSPKVSDTVPDTSRKTKTDLPIEIGQIRLTDSSVLFNDQFTKPNFRASLNNLAGTLGPLKGGAPGSIDITGTVDRTAPLSIQGRLDPFARDLFLDLKVIARGIEMPPMSPYSVKYLAYPIEKGKLSLDLAYSLQGGQLKAENKIFLDQLTLGDKVESPDAISAPVSLAVALLKNSRGEIDINLPISGSINDPEFKIGSIVFKAFINLIVKAATAPFSLIASLFGGGADLSQIDFAPGLASISLESAKAIESVAKAMNDRPALKLEITGTANATKDTDGAKRAILQRQVRAEKLAELAKKGESAAALRDIQVSPDEYPKYLTQVYKKAPFKKERNLMFMTKAQPVPEMERLLLENIQVAESELLALADQRSRAVRNQLVKQGVPAERVFVMGSKLGEAGRAEFSLR